jgi:hypothetical protein
VTRRDRAATVLAYECVRWHPLAEEAEDALESAEKALSLPLWAPVDSLANVVGRALCYARDNRRLLDDRASRLLRARLALLLRALLRADAGDYGPSPVCARCGSPFVSPYVGKAWCYGACRRAFVPTTRRITPLWERAPSHERGEL